MVSPQLPPSPGKTSPRWRTLRPCGQSLHHPLCKWDVAHTHPGIVGRNKLSYVWRRAWTQAQATQQSEQPQHGHLQPPGQSRVPGNPPLRGTVWGARQHDSPVGRGSHQPEEPVCLGSNWAQFLTAAAGPIASAPPPRTQGTPSPPHCALPQLPALSTPGGPPHTASYHP